MSTHHTSGPDSQTSRRNPYPRVLMLCGAALIIYGTVAPAVTLIRNVAQDIDVAKQTSIASRPATTGTSAMRAASTGVAIPSRQPREQVENKQQGVVQHKVTPIPSRKSIVAKNAAEARARDEIMELYEEWKDAWRTRDIDAIMRLYSPKVRFRIAGSPFVDYEGTRSAFLGLWQSTSYIVSDQVVPDLFFDGHQAILITGQAYKMPGQTTSGLSYTHRFVWEREDARDRNRIPSGVSPQKLPATQKSGQWRIVRSEYLSYQDAQDIRTQIY